MNVIFTSNKFYKSFCWKEKETTNTQNTENIIINLILYIILNYYCKCYLISGYYRIIISLSLIIAGYYKIIIINYKLKRSGGYVPLFAKIREFQFGIKRISRIAIYDRT